MYTRAVTQITELPASAEHVFERLRESRTLILVSRGKVSFDAEKELPEYWQSFEEVNLRPRLLGRSQGDHFVTFVQIDPTQLLLRTVERGGMVKRWCHVMRVTPITETRCLYTDHIEISAGILTPPVCLFAKRLYRHRHKRWLELLNSGEL